MERGYTFDDVCLVPQYNNIESRVNANIDMSTWLTKNTQTNLCIIPSNMDTVISDELAEVIVKNGGHIIFHRFCALEDQLEIAKKYGERCFISVGIKEDYEYLSEIMKYAHGVCIDIAHGHSKMMMNAIKKIKETYPTKEVIAGNVCTEQGYIDLCSAGADAVKVGIGGGSPCSTRVVTGFGCPLFSSIQRIARTAKKYKIPIIADGGIRNSRDVALSLAAGACVCMMGSLFSKTYESASKKYIKYTSKGTDYHVQVYNNKSVDLIVGVYQIIKYKIGDKVPFEYEIVGHYRGQASKNFQDEFKGGVKKGTVPEGVDFYTKCVGSAQEFIDDMMGSLRSALTYGGSKSIHELQTKAEFQIVTGSYITESFPRPEKL